MTNEHSPFDFRKLYQEKVACETFDLASTVEHNFNGCSSVSEGESSTSESGISSSVSVSVQRNRFKPHKPTGSRLYKASFILLLSQTGFHNYATVARGDQVNTSDEAFRTTKTKCCEFIAVSIMTGLRATSRLWRVGHQKKIKTNWNYEAEGATSEGRSVRVSSQSIRSPTSPRDPNFGPQRQIGAEVKIIAGGDFRVAKEEDPRAEIPSCSSSRCYQYILDLLNAFGGKNVWYHRRQQGSNLRPQRGTDTPLKAKPRQGNMS
ncbi:hypothetical protein L218DRAFT_947757 [Marasmius fiardii PR-910]|nr:hypothetical protein L218DRAFT_947757 [Marasmius fiardii PR-910]